MPRSINSLYSQIDLPDLTGAIGLVCSDEDVTCTLTDVTTANNNAAGIYIQKCAVEFGNVTISNNHSPNNGEVCGLIKQALL